MKQEEKTYAVHTQGENNPYGIKQGSIIWVHEINNSSVNDGEFIYFMYSRHGGTFGIVTGDTVESLSVDDVYNLSDCRVYRVEDERIER